MSHLSLRGDDICHCCGLDLLALYQPRFSSIISNPSPMTRFHRWWPLSASQWIKSQGRMIQYVLVDSRDPEYFGYYDTFQDTAEKMTFTNVSDLMNFALLRHTQCGEPFKRRLAAEVFSRINELQTTFDSGTPLKWANMLNRALTTMVLLWQSRSASYPLDYRPVQLGLAQWNVGLEKKAKRIRVIHKSNNIHSVYGYSSHGWRVVFADSMSLSPPPGGEFREPEELAAYGDEWFTSVWQRFKVETVSGLLFSLPALAHIALTFHSGTRHPIQLAHAKSTLALETLLKSKSLHQIHETSFVSLEKNDKMSPHHRPLQMAWEADWTMCYTSIVMEEKMPIGAPLIFNYENEREKTLVRRKGSHPFNSSEFGIISLIIQHWRETTDITIIDIYSQFSINGSFTIDKKSLDLLIVYKNKTQGPFKPRFAAYQVHHQFTHGCSICPPLKHYAGNVNLECIRAKSNRIDAFWASFCQAFLQHELTIIYSCHPFSLKGRLYRNGHAVDISQFALGMPADLLSKKTLSLTAIDELCQTNVCVIFIIAEGQYSTSDPNAFPTPIFTTDEAVTVMRAQTRGPTLFYGPYWNYLRRYNRFTPSQIYHVLVYPASPHYGPLCRALARQRSKKSLGQSIIKPGLNSAIGMMAKMTPVTQTTHLIHTLSSN